MSDKQQDKKTIRVTLAPGDANYIAELAQELGISETEVLRKGLKLMGAVSKAQQEKSSIIIENEEKHIRQELIIL